MKKIFALLSLLLIIANGYGQINFNYLQTDSLKKELSKAKDDTTRVLLMANISESYRWSHSDSAMFYGQQGLTLAERIKFRRGEAASLISMSVVQREIGNLAKALDLALKALSIAQQHGFGKEEISALLRVANVYAVSKNYSTAITYFLQAATKSRAIGSALYQGISYWLIAAAYEQTNRLDSAQLYADKALLYDKTSTGSAFAYNILGDIQMKKQNEPIGLINYWEGLKKAAEVSDYRTEANLNISLANYYQRKNLFDSAVYYGQKALATAQLLSYKNRIISASGILASLYEGKNDGEALRYYKLSMAAKDSLYGPEKMQQLQNLVMEEQQKQKEAEAAKIAYQTRTRQYALVGGLAVFLIIMVLLYYNNRKKQKANRLLHQQKTEIQRTLAELKTTQAQLIQAEKMASLGELTAGIAHEIQNPLNFINNFSELNKEMIQEMNDEINKANYEEVKMLGKNIEENSEKITQHGKRADAIVKGMLQHSRTSTGKKEFTDINALADEYLRLSYHGLRAKDKSFNSSFVINFDDSIGQIEIMSQEIGRVLLNLYNNAFYAVNEKRKQLGNVFEPTVEVVTRKERDHIIISVKDNGNGIPQKLLDKIYQPFFTTKPTGEGTGLGLSLSFDIVTKGHGGEMKVETAEGRFTEFKIILPARSKDIHSN